MRQGSLNRRWRGFSLLELMLVMTFFAMISTVVVLLFTQGSYTYRHGETHIEMQRGGRHLIARITPYVASMFDAENPALSPLVEPFAADPNAVALEYVEFTTTEDWLNVAYPSPLTTATLASSTEDLRNFTYRIGLDADENVILRRRIPDPANAALTVDDVSRILYRKRAGEDLVAVPADPNDPTGPKARLRFRLVRANLLVLEFTVRSKTKSSANQTMETTEQFRTTFNLPTKLL